MYKAVFLDIDDTILDFDLAEKYSISIILKNNLIEPTEELIKLYHDIDLSWWKKYELGTITKSELLQNRFKEFFDLLAKEVDIDKTNKEYLYHLGDKIFYIEKAQDLLKYLGKKYDVYFCTNGVYNTQMRRINLLEDKHLIKNIYISEQLNLKKPDKEFFDYCLKDNNLSPNEVIIIGDSQSSDIQGGINSNIDTIWFNPHNQESKVHSKYIVNSLDEIKNIL